MKHLKTASLTLVFTSLSSIVGVLAQTRSARPISALNLLRTREPKVVWNAGSLLKADFDYDGIDDYALGGKTSLGYVVGVVKAPISAQSKHWTLRFSAGPGDQGS